MPLLRTDDDVRRLRLVWLGPDGSWRWPFDARYSAWGLALVLVPTLTAALWLAIPMLVVVTAAAVGLYRAAVRRAADRRIAWLLTGSGGAVALLTVPPGSLLMPMPLPAAALCGFAAAIALIRAVMRHVDYDRPVRYWTSMVWQTAGGPRRRRKPVTIRPS